MCVEGRDQMMLMPVSHPAQSRGASGLHRGSYEASLQR